MDLAQRVGARIATQLYCPPATGYALHISAMEYATASVTRQTQSQPQTMTGGPPLSTPMIRTPDRAVQDVTMLKEKPTIPRSPKLRLSSRYRQRSRYYHGCILTLSVSKLRKHIVVTARIIDHLLLQTRRRHVYQLILVNRMGRAVEHVLKHL